MKSVELGGDITGISVQGQENMLVSILNYRGWGQEDIADKTRVYGNSSIRWVTTAEGDGRELQIARDSEPGEGWVTLATPRTGVSHCTVVLGAPHDRLKDGYVEVEGCKNVSLRLGGLSLSDLRVDRLSTNEARTHMISLEDVTAEESTIHLDHGSFTAKGFKTNGLMIAHSTMQILLNRTEGLQLDMRKPLCPGPNCYDNLFEPLD